MAQYFYDLSQVNPATNFPLAAKGYIPDASVFRNFGRTLLDGEPAFAFSFKTASETDNHRYYGLGVSHQDCEILFRGRQLNTATSSYANTGLGFAFRVQTLNSSGRPADCYYVTNGQDGGFDDLTLYKMVGGSQTQIASLAGALPSKSGGEQYNHAFFIRLKAAGSSLQARIWWEDESEPATWDIDATDTTISVAGDIALACHQYEQSAAQYFIAVGTDSDAPPTANAGTVSGIVLLPNGDPADGYLVRCYHRDSGILLADSTTDASGAYAFSTLDTADAVTILAVDQLGNSWNAQVNDLVVPV